MILRFKKKANISGYAQQLEIDTTAKTFTSGYFVFNGTACELKSKDFENLINELEQNEFQRVLRVKL